MIKSIEFDEIAFCLILLFDLFVVVNLLVKIGAAVGRVQ